MFRPSKLDGDEPGGFVIVNLESPYSENGLAVCETDSGETAFATLVEARETCRRLRSESGNDRIYIYALVGVKEAIRGRPGHFPIR